MNEQRRPIWIALAVCTLIGITSLTLRAVEFPAVHCRWDTHAYGSVVW